MPVTLETPDTYRRINSIGLIRDFESGVIIVAWTDEVTGDHEQCFKLGREKEALEFTLKQFVRSETQDIYARSH